MSNTASSRDWGIGCLGIIFVVVLFIMFANKQFQRRTAEHRKLCQRACEALFGIADKDKRLDALNDRWQKLQQLMNERAASPEMQNVVGGNTGIVYIRRRVVNSLGHVLVVEKVDQALMREFQEHEKQAFKELGQWGRPPS